MLLLLRLALRRLGDRRGAAEAVADARRCLENWHLRFSRFVASSELSRLNADPREVVPVSTTMAQLLASCARPRRRPAGSSTARCCARSRPRATAPTSPRRCRSRSRCGSRRRAARRPPAPWRDFTVDGWEVTRPPGLAFDSGGLAKGLFADLLAERLAGLESFAVDCGGDLRFAGPERTLEVADPFGGAPLHVPAGRGRRGHERDRPAQLARPRRPPGAPPARPRDRPPGVHRRRPGDRARADRGRGRVARQGRGAERPGRGRDWLAHGGVVVLDDRSHFTVPVQDLVPQDGPLLLTANP